MHIDLDAFFVSVEQALDPGLKGKPVIVGGDPERRGVVSSASYEARGFGIHAGMPSSRARRLCPQAIFVHSKFSRYQDASARFMEILAGFSPYIEPLSLDEAYLDITGFEEAYGSPRNMALAIKKRASTELNITASAGIATCKVIAKIASDLCKPDGLLEIETGKEQEFLNPLPVAKLPGVGPRTEQALKQMDVKTIGDLASLPLAVVKGHFGKFGVELHHYANAIDNRRVEARGESLSISKQITFARDTLDLHFLEANLHRMCEEVGAELRFRDKQASCVTLRLRYADFRTITRQSPLKPATNSSQVIFTVASQVLNKVLARKGKQVRLIGVRVSGLSCKKKQLTLFDPETRKLESLDKAIDQIRRKYGRSSIRTGRGLAGKDS